MNAELTRFLKERRTKVRKSQSVVATEIGDGVTQTQYAQWEVNGRLPKNPARLAKLAQALETTVEELMEKSGNVSTNPSGLMSLIRAIAKSNCETIRLEDVKFLLDTQQGLGQTMSPELIDTLMKHRA